MVSEFVLGQAQTTPQWRYYFYAWPFRDTNFIFSCWKYLSSERTFLLRKCQEPVGHKTTESSSIEFIGYRMLQHDKMAAQSHLQAINQQKCQAFSISLIGCLDIGILSWSD